ncbi:MAG: GMP synthase [Candidatus Binatia bacterium]|nr:GMP synthase [Candidatus Binatia bacterium]
MRIGILKADTVLPQLSHFGQYTEMFPQIIGPADPGLEFRSFDVEHDEYPDAIDDCDGYLITGSRHSVYDPMPWIRTLEDFVVRLHERQTKLLAVCFGHQLVARALGGKTEPAERGWTIGVQRSQVDTAFPWASDVASATRLIHSHKDQVTELPPGAELIGGNDACPIGLYRIGTHIMSVQAHPEFSPEYARALYEMRREAFGDGLYREAVASLDDGTDREVFAGWIASFFRAP